MMRRSQTSRNKVQIQANAIDSHGTMLRSGIELGDIISPAWDGDSWDAELGIAYHGKNGPVFYTGKGIETTDDL